MNFFTSNLLHWQCRLAL